MAKKKYYKISELVEMGYPKTKLRKLCKSEIANILILPRDNDSGTFYINIDQLEKYWGWY